MTTLQLNGLTAEEAFQQVTDKGISSNEAATLVSGWIYENFGKTRRTFNFSQDFAATDSSCASDFDRTFEHLDWIDGESVVQAESSVGEEGFNARFHNIETDLDGLANNLNRAFSCLAQQRAELSALLAEVRAEINRINGDIHDCCHKDVDLFSRNPVFNGLVKGAGFLGTTTLGEKNVSVWETEQGLMMLPATQLVDLDVGQDVRLNMAGKVGGFLTENKEIADALTEGASVSTLIKTYGDELVEPGLTFRAALNILPAGAKFAMPQAMIDALAERQASVLRTTKGTDAAIAAAFGLESMASNIGTAGIDHLTAIPSRTRGALIRQGIENVGALAELAPAEIVNLLQLEGVAHTEVEVAEWSGLARTLNLVR